MELMKSFLQRKMDEEGCDALELAAVMLKAQIGDKGPEIEEDRPAGRSHGQRFGDRRRGDSRRGDRHKSDSRRRNGKAQEQGENRGSRQNRDRRPRDLRRDGSEKGIAFALPKRKRSSLDESE